MISQQQNGSINAKFTPTFEPEQIALKYKEGKGVHSPYNGDQVLFTLSDGRKWFTDLYVAQKIEQMRIEPGEVFAVQKTEIRRGNRRIVEIQITPVVPETPAEPEKKPVGIAPVSGSGSSSADHLTRCYRDAVDIVAAAVEYARSKGLTLAPEFGDIRALAATICINETNGRRAA